MLVSSGHRYRNLLALLLTVPVNSIGIMMLLIIAPGLVGQNSILLSQLWLLVCPLIWLFIVEKQPLKIPPFKPEDWIRGTIIGLLMFATILAVYGLWVRHWNEGLFVLA